MRKQGAINLAGALVRIAAAVVAMPLTVRFCGLEEFGRWSFLLSIGTVLATCDFGLPTTVTVYVSREFCHEPDPAVSARVSYVAVSSLLVATAMGLIAVGIMLVGPFLPATQKFFGVGRVDIVLAASMGLFVGSRVLTNVAAAFLQAAANYAAFVSIGLIFVLPTAVGLPLAAYYGFDAVAFLHIHTIFSIGTLLAYLVACSAMRRERGWRGVVDRREWAGMARFGLGSWLGSAGGILFSQLDRVVVGMLLSAQQLGIYAAATLVTSQINALSAIPVQPLLPFVARYAHDINGHLRELRILVSNAIRVNTAIALALSALSFVYAPVIAAAVVQPDSVSALTSALRTLSIVYGAYSLNAVGFYCMFATHDLRRLCLITIGSGLLTLVAIAMGAQVAGLMGAAIGNLPYVLTLTLTAIAIRRFGMSVVLWLRIIWVPLCAWAAVIVFAIVFDIRGPIAASILAVLLLVNTVIWVFRPMAATYSMVLMQSAPTHR
jgi:O-antigen/teichoic acid export membrane protein